MLRGVLAWLVMRPKVVGVVRVSVGVLRLYVVQDVGELEAESRPDPAFEPRCS